MGGNKTPIIDENELYNQAVPWVHSYFESLAKDPNAPSTTIVPDYLRRITVAEAALLQTLPRDYQFQGSQSMKYTQIGNAVPCNLGKAVVRMVIDVLNGKAQMIRSSQTLSLAFD